MIRPFSFVKGEIMLNALATTITTFSGYGMPDAYKLSFIGEFIKLLIEGVGSIGVGIIVFTLILKVITLPLDVYSRVSTKKMALKQEAMKPELEKLQRQYANNKELYNKKMMALQKKQGISMLSSCLPMIVTIVFFIVVINQFTAYSNYTNLSMINSMSSSYTKALTDYNRTSGKSVFLTDEDGNVKVVNGMIELNEETVYPETELSEYNIERKTENGEVYYYTDDIQKLGELVELFNQKGFTKTKVGENERIYKDQNGYHLNTAKSSSSEEVIKKTISKEVAEFAFDNYIQENILPVARKAAAKTYYEMAPSFLWVKNLWVPDLPWKHPVLNTIAEYNFKDIENNGEAGEAEFKEITYELSQEKTQPNGYLVLVVLSIGVMLLSQLIMQKTQKTQMQLSSVDGQGAQTQKMMMWMMPVMFGVFAFIYNASFSIYMIISSGLSTISTLIINKIVEKKFIKQAEEDAIKNDKRFFKK